MMADVFKQSKMW